MTKFVYYPKSAAGRQLSRASADLLLKSQGSAVSIDYYEAVAETNGRAYAPDFIVVKEVR